MPAACCVVQNLMVDDVRVAVSMEGSGEEPVALLHCSGSSAAQWRDLAALLVRDGFRVVAPDLYGCGATGAWPGRRPIRIADHARMIAEVIRAQGRQVHLVGHSFGGAVALRVALDFPELLHSLVLVEPVPFHVLRGTEPADRALYAEIRSVASAIFECTLSGHGQKGMAHFVDYWNGEGAWKHLPDGLQARLTEQIGGIATNFTALFADMTSMAEYRGIDVPTLVLRGSESPGPARRVAELVARAVPHAALRTIHGAGHMLPLTHAAMAGAEITAFIAQGPRRDASAA
jgi:pimeloyl-ACP methyl ester carboxylesterase